MSIVDYSNKKLYIYLEFSFVSCVYHISKKYISLFRFICFSKFTHIGTCQLCLLHFFSLNHDNDRRKVMWWKKCILDFKIWSSGKQVSINRAKLILPCSALLYLYTLWFSQLRNVRKLKKLKKINSAEGHIRNLRVTLSVILNSCG